MLNSPTLASRSAVHLFMISSRVLPRSIDGGATATDIAVVADIGYYEPRTSDPFEILPSVSFLSPSFVVVVEAPLAL